MWCGTSFLCLPTWQAPNVTLALFPKHWETLVMFGSPPVLPSQKQHASTTSIWNYLLLLKLRQKWQATPPLTQAGCAHCTLPPGAEVAQTGRLHPSALATLPSISSGKWLPAKMMPFISPTPFPRPPENYFICAFRTWNRHHLLKITLIEAKKISHIFSSLLLQVQCHLQGFGTSSETPWREENETVKEPQVVTPTSILLCADTAHSSRTGQTQEPVSSKSHLTTSGKSPHWVQPYSEVAASGPCQHGQGCSWQCKLTHYMLEVAQTELLSLPGLNSSLVFSLQWLWEVWGRESCLVCTVKGGLFYKRRLEQLSRMKAKKGHNPSLQNRGEKRDRRSNQTESDETCLCKRTILA